MLLSHFVRFAFWALFGFVLLAILGLLAINLGVADWALNDPVREKSGVGALNDVVVIHKDSIDLSIKGIGLAFTLIIGTLTFLAGWYYSAFQFPLRLAQYAAYVRGRHFDDRATALAPHATKSLGWEEARQKETFAQRVLAAVTPRFVSEMALQRSQGKANLLDADVKVLDESLKLTKGRRVTIHLVRGLELAASARSIAPGTAQTEKNEEALAEFKKALDLEANDVDALELAARQARVMKLYTSAEDYLARLVAAATNTHPTRQARALRYQAELLEERNTKAALRDARVKLEAALELLEGEGASEEKPIELALLNEQLGSLHLKRGTPTLVGDYLNEGAMIFETLAEPQRSQGLERIERLRGLLTRALRGDDEPDELDAAVSHVTIAIVNVFVEPKATEKPAQQLPQYSGVTIIKDGGEWAQIAKAGKPLGYVAARDLRALL